jgi:type III secretory pathway component EscU
MTIREEPGGGIPPSASRLAAAARRGRFPRSRLLVTGLSLLAAAAVFPAIGRFAASRLAEALRDGLGRALPSLADPGAALADATTLALGIALLLLAAPAAVSLIASLAPALRARRARGNTTVELPPERAGESSPAAPRLAALVLALPVVLWILGRHRELPASWMAGEPGLAAALGGAIAELLAGVGLLCALAGLAELALGRSRIRSALSLSRSEAARERRSGRGDDRARGELRAAGYPEEPR